MAMITIGGVALPNPTAYQVSQSDLDSDNTDRNAAGVLLRDRVRAGVYKVEVAWTVQGADYRQIVAQLSPARLDVLFFNPFTATTHQAYMYVGDRSGNLISLPSEARPGDSLWELSCALVEY